MQKGKDLALAGPALESRSAAMRAMVEFLIKHAAAMTAADLHYFTYRLALPIDFLY
jgi:hypothetical protein